MRSEKMTAKVESPEKKGLPGSGGLSRDQMKLRQDIVYSAERMLRGQMPDDPSSRVSQEAMRLVEKSKALTY